MSNQLLQNGRSPEWAWRSLLGILESWVSRPVYNQWIKPTEFKAYEAGTFLIGVPDEIHLIWWKDRLSRLVCRQLVGICNGPAALDFVIDTELELRSTIISRFSRNVRSYSRKIR